MSRLISELLNTDQPAFFQQIRELEGVIGKPGIDIRLSNELGLLFKEKAGLLGLDRDDTTAKELYFSMSNLALEDSRRLAAAIGIKAEDSPQKMIEKSVGFVEKRLGPRSVWTLKASVARRQLKDNPPKKLMKIFGIRSIDSALKRERPSLLYCFARLSEPEGWLSRFASQADKLKAGDFDNQKLSLSQVPLSRRRQLSKAGIKLNRIVYADPETASIEIAPPEKRFQGDVLFVADSILAQIKEIVLVSTYYKSFSLDPLFAARVKKIRQSGLPAHSSAGHPFGWPILMHAASQFGAHELLQYQEAPLSPEELLVPSAAQLGGFDFWKHPFGLYRQEGVTISFNLSDMIVNAANNTPAEGAYAENARASLRNELFARYLLHEPIRRRVIEESQPEVGLS